MQLKGAMPPHMSPADWGFEAADRMEKDCRQWRATTVVKTALRKLPDPFAPAQERADPYKCLLGGDRARELAGQASARKTSAMMRLGRFFPATAEFAKQLRIRPHEVRRSVEGESKPQ